MRTLAFILLLVALCLLMAIGMVMPVRAQESGEAATLDVVCDGGPIPLDVDAVTMCTFTARNTRSVAMASGSRWRRHPIGASPDLFDPEG